MQGRWCDAPIHLTLRPSPRLTLLHAVTHAGAVGALWYAAVPLLPSALLTALVIAHGAWVVRLEWRTAHPRRIRRLVSLPDGNWRLVTGDGRERAARLLGGGLVHPRLTVLAFRCAGEWYPRGVAFTPDNVAARPFRRLRVRLRLAGRRAGEKGPVTGEP